MGNDARPRLLLVDLSNALVRAYSRLPEEKRTVEDLDYLVTGMVRKGIRTVKATHVVLVLDSIEPCWRYEYHPGYKSGRNADDLTPKQLTQIVGPALRRRGLQMLYRAGMEADDLMHTAALKCHEYADVFLYTRDSDMYAALDTPNVQLLWPENGGKLRLIGNADAEAQLGHPVAWLPAVRALIADRKDNLRGLLGDDVGRCAITRPRAIELLGSAKGSIVHLLDPTRYSEHGFREKEQAWVDQYIDEILALTMIATLRGDAALRVDPMRCDVRRVNLETPRRDG